MYAQNLDLHPLSRKKTLGIIEHPYINSYPLRTLVAKTHPIQIKISNRHQASNLRPPTSVLAQKQIVPLSDFSIINSDPEKL